jgi:predicted permease
MLQRIQSIYLFLAGLAIFALYLFPLVHNVYVGSTPTSIMVTGSYTDAGGQQQMQTHFVALSAVTAIVGLIPIAIIFLFRNRKQQIALSWSALLVIIGYSFWIAQAAKTITGDVTLKTANFGIGMLLCPVSIVLLIAAVRAIQRDEKLIRSADRLR